METKNDKETGNEIDFFFLLPEGCLANTISLTTPLDACRLTSLGSTIRAAADSNFVWEKFLPNDYEEFINRSVQFCQRKALSFVSKKELYLYLCDHPLIIDGGTKSFTLEKSTGKKCFMLAARDLCIVWGDTPRYWRWTAMPFTTFGQVAELVNVCWLELNGKISTNMLSKDTVYSAYLVFKLKPRHFGFDYRPQHMSVGLVGSRAETRSIHLNSEGIERKDGWLEVEMGTYVNDQEDRELKMSLLGMNGGNWKSGLIVQGIEIRPSAR